MSDQHILLQTITINRLINGDTGTESLNFDYQPEGETINWITSLGMLEAAKQDLHERMQQHWATESRDDDE